MTTRPTNKSLTYGVREAKARLSELLTVVREGTEIVITHHGKPVGKLVPVDPEELSLEERLLRLEQLGVIEPRVAHPRQPLPPPVPVAGSIAQSILQDQRNN